ncbi:Stereocilin [Holothuria leucospilota]|uniref:Stereocilin n=1 Tax=Holothuria leucospilota TaxID=206669 RepID=A0A9Q0YQK5_HOLLE|nr:Stereocilin [Holothuria leucospilota]
MVMAVLLIIAVLLSVPCHAKYHVRHDEASNPPPQRLPGTENILNCIIANFSSILSISGSHLNYNVPSWEQFFHDSMEAFQRYNRIINSHAGENSTFNLNITNGFFQNNLNITKGLMSNHSALMRLFNESLSQLDRVTQMFVEVENFMNWMRGNFSYEAPYMNDHTLQQWERCKHLLEHFEDGSYDYEYEDSLWRLTESTTFKTLQKLGIIEILNGSGINPVDFLQQMFSEDAVWGSVRPFLGFRYIKFIEPRRIQNLSSEELFDLLVQVELDRESYYHLLSNVKTEYFEQVLNFGKEFVHTEGLPPPSVTAAVVDAAEVQWGPLQRWTVEHVHKLWLFAVAMGKDRLKKLSSQAFQAILPNLATLHKMGELDHMFSVYVTSVAKHHWGSTVSQWNIAQLQRLGPFISFLSVDNFISMDTDDLLIILPEINRFEFDRRQGHAIVANIASSRGWTWSVKQVKSLGGLAAYMTVEDMKNLPREVFSDPEIEQYLVQNTQGRGREAKEVTKRIVESLGDPSTWDQEEMSRIGKVAGGLEVQDLQKIPKSSIRSAVSDLTDAALSPRQRSVIAKKYRAASNGTSKRLSADDIHELKSLAVGLGSEVFAEMSPDDVKKSIEVLSGNADEMQPTQRKEIVRQMKRASGGLAGSLKDLGSMVKEVPLKDLDALKLEDIGVNMTSGDNSSDPTLTLGIIQWNRGQSTKIFRKVKQELFSKDSNIDKITSSTISMLGTVIVGMTCEDIGRLETNDIFRLVDTMMKQTGWTLRQTRCISDRVRSYEGSRENFMSNFTIAEVNSLTGQVLKEFSVKELSALPTSVCDVAFAGIGEEKELEGIRRSKRQEIAQEALKCLKKTLTNTTITGEDMESLGYLGCELKPEDIQRVNVAELSTSTLEIASKCCYDRFQMVSVGQKVIEEFGSSSTWTSVVLESVAPFLLYLSPQEVEAIDEDELSIVAESIMGLYAEFNDEKLPLCERDLTDADLEERKDGFIRVAIKVKEAMVAAAEGQQARKRRDTTYTPTCDEIELLEDGNIAWTEEELASMTVETFENCVHILGDVSGLSSGQLDVLMEKAVEAWGSPSQMTSDDICLLGRIATRFDPSELAVLNLTSIDTVYALAEHGNWSREQMSAIVSRYLEVSQHSIDSLNSVELTGLSSFVCGLTAVQISLLNSSAYSESASSLGVVEVCSTDQLSALKEHAVVVFGPISSWQPEIFTEVGVVVAGFTAEELSGLNTSSLAGITPLAISLIPPATFGAGFTLDLLHEFDESQALAVTEEQLASLSSSQNLALVEAEYGQEEIPQEIILEIEMGDITKPVTDVTRKTSTEKEDDKSGGDMVYSATILLTCITVGGRFLSQIVL